MSEKVRQSAKKPRRILYALCDGSLGKALIAASDRGLCALFLGDEPEAMLAALRKRFPQAEPAGGDESFARIAGLARALIEKPGQGFEPPLDIEGSPFQLEVWQALRDIPPGSTTSYAQIAERIGRPRAVRAVARAIASNNVAVAVPCHRVVRSSGALCGYRWGVERKRKLLEREAAACRISDSPARGRGSGQHPLPERDQRRA